MKESEVGSDYFLKSIEKKREEFNGLISSFLQDSLENVKNCGDP